MFSGIGHYIEMVGLIFQTDPSNVFFFVLIENNIPDIYKVFSGNNLPLANGAQVTSIRWSLSDFTGSAFSSDALPVGPPDLADFQDSDLIIEGISADQREFFLVAGSITTAQLRIVVGGEIIPIDMTLLLVAGALTNAYWIIPTLAGIAGAVIAITRGRRGKGKQ